MLTALTREFSYPFDLSSAIALESLEKDPSVLIRGLLPIRRALPDWPQLRVPDPWVAAVKSGQSIPTSCFPASVYANQKPGAPFHALFLHEDCELALATLEQDREPVWRITRGLW